MSGPEDAPTPGEATLAEALGAAPDVMADPVQRERHAALRARLFAPQRREGRFGRYRLERRLGAGATGVVHVAHDPVLDRRVALKILRDPGGDERPRLLREARALAQVSHPNVVEVFEVGELDGEAFIALELVDGVTLRQWAQERPRRWREVVDAYVQAGRGLAAAHAHGLVHRDFKPDNAMIDRHGRVRVLDFGLARPLDAVLTPTEGGEAEAHDVGLTRSGMIVGTPAYMARELLEGAPADAGSDQFALGVAIYEALYGERPFEGTTLPELTANVLGDVRRPRPRGVSLPRGLDAAVERALSAEPAARWPGVAAFVDALQRVEARARRRRWAWSVPGVAVAAAITAAVLVAREPAPVATTCRPAEARLAQVWGPPQREALRARWAGPDGALGPGAQAVVDTLDERTEAWARAWTEACEDLLSADDLAHDGRIRCLEQRLEQLAGLVDALEGLPAARLRRALPLVDALPTDACTPEAGFPLPADPERARRVEAALADLRRAGVQCRLEGPAACRERIESGLAEARTLEHPPLVVFALQQAGAMESMDGDLSRAEERFDEAFFTARSGGLDEAAARAAVALVSLVGYDDRRPEDAERWARQAEAVLAGLDRAERLRGDLLNNRGLVHMSQGHTAEAERDYLAAIEQYEQADEPLPISVAITLGNLAQVAYERRDLGQALAQLDRALELRTQRYGPEHPEVASVLNNRGLVHMERGDLDAAVVDLRHAIEIVERNFGPAHIELEHALANLARVHARQRDHQAARVVLERAAGLLDGLPPDHPRRLSIASQLVEVQAALGPAAPAIEALERILSQQRAAPGVDPTEVTSTRLRLAEVLLRDGRADQARPHLRAVVDQLEASQGPVAPALADPATALGECLLAQAEPAEALALLERAWSLREREEGFAAERARTAFALARALAAAAPDPQPRALALAEQARAAYAQAGPAFDDSARQVERWLARQSRDRFP